MSLGERDSPLLIFANIRDDKHSDLKELNSNTKPGYSCMIIYRCTDTPNDL